MENESELLHGLIQLTDQESKNGNWRVTLDYENCGDVARVLDGDGNVIGECGDLDKDPNEQFMSAIQQAIKKIDKKILDKNKKKIACDIVRNITESLLLLENVLDSPKCEIELKKAAEHLVEARAHLPL